MQEREINPGKGINYVAKKFPYTTLMTWEFYKHRHSFWEIIICLKGNAYHYINEVKYEFDPGDIIIMKPGNVHDYKIIDKDNYAHYDLYCNNEDIKSTCDYIEDTLYTRFSSDSNPIKFNVSKKITAALKEKLALLNSLQQKPQFNQLSQTIYKTIVNLICGLAAENMQAELDNVPAWLSKILAIMSSKEHIGDSVADIVALSGFSHGHLSRMFREHTGETISAYFTRIKMNYANVLFRNMDINILDISLLLGYESLSHFIHIFKKHNGITPKQYRKQLYITK